MTEKITGIVLDMVRHNDSTNIVTLYTRSRGRVAFLSSASGGKAGKLRKARLMPLSVVEASITFHENRDIQRLGQFSLSEVWKTLYFDPYKSAVVLFITDFLNRYFRNASPDELAFDFIIRAFRELDCDRTDVGNFHISFLINFLRYAGIFPDLSSYEPGDYLDMRGGVTVDMRPSHDNYLSAADTMALMKLSRINFRNSRKFRMTGENRGEVLGKLLKYYAMFYPGIDNIKSLDVLSEVFS